MLQVFEWKAHDLEIYGDYSVFLLHSDDRIYIRDQ